MTQIQGYIESLITTASSSSTLAYLRILHLSHTSAQTLISDLKSHEFFRTTASTSAVLSSKMHADRSSIIIAGQLSTPSSATGPGAAVAGVGVVAVSMMLELAMEELFMPYLEGARYLDKEGKSLTELYAGRLIRFTSWHVCCFSFRMGECFNHTDLESHSERRIKQRRGTRFLIEWSIKSRQPLRSRNPPTHPIVVHLSHLGWDN